MIIEPTVTELLKTVDNRFELVVMISKRARQISQGAMQLINIKESSALTIAANEIAEGKVKKC